MPPSDHHRPRGGIFFIPKEPLLSSHGFSLPRDSHLLSHNPLLRPSGARTKSDDQDPKGSIPIIIIVLTV